MEWVGEFSQFGLWGDLCKQASKARLHRSVSRQQGVTLSCRDTPGAGEHRQVQGLVTKQAN